MGTIRRYKGYTLAQLPEAEAELELWKEARRAAATGKQYQIGSQMLTRYDLPQINAMIDELADVVDVLSGASGNGPTVVLARKVRR